MDTTMPKHVLAWADRDGMRWCEDNHPEVPVSLGRPSTAKYVRADEYVRLKSQRAELGDRVVELRERAQAAEAEADALRADYITDVGERNWHIAQALAALREVSVAIETGNIWREDRQFALHVKILDILASTPAPPADDDRQLGVVNIPSPKRRLKLDPPADVPHGAENVCAICYHRMDKDNPPAADARSQQLADGGSSRECDDVPPSRLDIVCEVFKALAVHLRYGGTFRTLIYRRLRFSKADYDRLYSAGGMTVSSALNDARDAENAPRLTQEEARKILDKLNAIAGEDG